MSDIDVLVDTWIQPAGRVDIDLVLAAMHRHLARLADTGRLDLPGIGALDIARIRLDGAAIDLMRVGDAEALGLALARAVAATLSGGRA